MNSLPIIALILSLAICFGSFLASEATNQKPKKSDTKHPAAAAGGQKHGAAAAAETPKHPKNVSGKKKDEKTKLAVKNHKAEKPAAKNHKNGHKDEKPKKAAPKVTKAAAGGKKAKVNEKKEKQPAAAGNLHSSKPAASKVHNKSEAPAPASSPAVHKNVEKQHSSAPPAPVVAANVQNVPAPEKQLEEEMPGNQQFENTIPFGDNSDDEAQSFAESNNMMMDSENEPEMEEEQMEQNSQLQQLEQNSNAVDKIDESPETGNDADNEADKIETVSEDMPMSDSLASAADE